MSDHPEVELMEPVSVNAIQAIEKAEIDIQISTAKQYPRSLQTFKSRATDMATLDKETAESCIYSRPVGKKNGKMQFAQGESIRLAEIVAASYGNIRHGSSIIEQTPRFVKARGVAHDLETNNFSSSEVMESTVDKSGNPYSERQRALMAKVACAKAQRDAIFKIVPKALCKPVYDAAVKTMQGGKSLDERREDVITWIKSLKVDAKRVWAALGVKGPADLGNEELVTLAGIHTAMKNGDTTVEEAFPPAGGGEAEASSDSRLKDLEKDAKKKADEPPKPKSRKKAEAKPASKKLMGKDELVEAIEAKGGDMEAEKYLAIVEEVLGDVAAADALKEQGVTKLETLLKALEG